MSLEGMRDLTGEKIAGDIRDTREMKDIWVKYFCVMGKSASGKGYDLPAVDGSTRAGTGADRTLYDPADPGKRGGRTGSIIFVDRARYEALLAAGKVIEARSYDTHVWRVDVFYRGGRD